jgi:hypothetical protein
MRPQLKIKVSIINKISYYNINLPLSLSNYITSL